MRGIFVAGIALLALAGCASNYKKFYQPAQGVTPQSVSQFRSSPPTADPLVERVSSQWNQETVDAYQRRGYGVIGFSSFTSGQSESDQAAVQQAIEVGADLVAIIQPKYIGSTTTSVPFTTPTTTTSYSTGSATAFGPKGVATAYGSGTTTTYGSTTTYIPITAHRSEYGAVYMVKVKTRLGLVVRELNDSERQELQSNKGVAVRVVMNGSPAFNADILPGDVLTSIDGEALSEAGRFGDVVAARAGRLVEISLVRRGQTIKKTVQLGA